MGGRMGEHAVVLGGSIAGLLGARVLSQSYERVSVIERDALPIEEDHRRGVPQSRHVHGVLPRGRELLEDLFDGLTDELVESGALTGDAAASVRFMYSGHRLARTSSATRGLFLSRTLLEGALRKRVRAIPGVSILDATNAVGIVTTSDRRRIVAVRARPGGDSSRTLELPAELVMDATGRGSRLPAWLTELGLRQPPRDEVSIGVRYASRTFRLRRDALGSDQLVIIGGTPSCPRGGALQAIEGGRHLCSLAGSLGDAPPTDLSGFVRFARTLPFPDLNDAIVDAQPLDDGFRFGYPANVRVRYERLRGCPAGLFAIGDALCSLNPIYGQGITVIAMQAAALRQMLAGGAAPVPGRYFRGMARVIEAPWNTAVGADLVNPAVAGRRTIAIRLVNAYTPRLHAAAASDPKLAAAFLRVAGLIDPTRALMRPDRVVRVVAASLRQTSRATAGRS